MRRRALGRNLWQARNAISKEATQLRRDELIREFIQTFPDGTPRDWAKAADAKLDLLRIEKVRSAMIEHAIGDTTTRSCDPDLDRLMHRIFEIDQRKRLNGSAQREPFESSESPCRRDEGDEQQEIYAFRKILPDLVRTLRYEKRAVSRRDRAINALSSPSLRRE